MAIPPEIQQLIPQVRQQYPQLAHLPDEVVAQLILQTMQEQQAGLPVGNGYPNRMSSKELTLRGQQLLNMGQLDEAEEYLLQGFEKAEQENDPQMQCEALGCLGYLLHARGDLPQALAIFQQVLCLAKRLNDQRVLYLTYEQIGKIYTTQGKYYEARENFKKSLEICEKMQFRKDMYTVIYKDISFSYNRQGDLHKAAQFLEKALQYPSEDGTIAAIYGDLGYVYQQEGKFKSAIDILQKALEIQLRIGDQNNAAAVYGILGNIYRKIENYGQASKMLHRSVEIFERVGNELQMAGSIADLAIVYTVTGNIRQALAYYHQALEIQDRIGDQHGAAWTYFNLGNLYREQGDAEQARTHYEKAKALFEIVGATRDAQNATQALRQL